MRKLAKLLSCVFFLALMNDVLLLDTAGALLHGAVFRLIGINK